MLLRIEARRAALLGLDLKPQAEVSIMLNIWLASPIAALRALDPKLITQLKDRLFRIDPSWTVESYRAACDADDAREERERAKASAGPASRQ